MRAEQKGPVCACPLSAVLIVITMADRLSLMLLLFVSLHYEILTPSLIMNTVCPLFVVYGLGHITYFYHLLCRHELQHASSWSLFSKKSLSLPFKFRKKYERQEAELLHSLQLEVGHFLLLAY